METEPPVPDRFLPPDPRAGRQAVGRSRIITLVALVVLVVLAFGSYLWFTDNVARREAAIATGKEPGDDGVAVPPPVEVQDVVQPVAALGDINDPDQRRSVCGYLAAEAQRLSYEFKQPLPPPVVDRIATEIGQVREQASRHGCDR